MRRLLPPTASVALAGAATMALEILLPRRLAPVVGTTSVVWTAVFAVVLAALALGAALGSRAADADGAPAREARRLLLAGVFAAAAPFLARAGAAVLGDVGVGGRAIGAMAAGGFLPCLFLGAVYPVAVARALRTSTHRGRALGRLAAAGAIGSVAGTWIASYGLIPHLAVTTSFYVVAGLLVATAAARAGADPVAPSGGAAGPRGAHPPRTEEARPLAHPALCNALVGAATLALEVVAGRRVAIDAGSSLEAWTAVIVVVLAGLSLGGALGGRWADRAGPRRATTTALLLGAVLAAATPWTARAVVATRTLAFGFGERTAIGVALAYLPLFTVLGTIPPMLARAAVAGHGDAGRRAGWVSAAGTVGALAGVLAGGPWLVPALRLEGSAAAMAALLAALAAATATRRVVPLLVAGAAIALAVVARADVAAVRAFGLAIGLRPDADGVWVRDGAYARIVVEHAPMESSWYGRSVLRMKIDARTHGIHDPADAAWIGSKYGGMYDAVSRHLRGDRAAPRVLFLGGGTYTAPRAILRAWPHAHVDVAEIDPDVTRGAQERMGLVATPGLAWEHEDARTVVRRGAPRDAGGRPSPYDLVFADAFGDVGVPWHLTTLEFLAEARATMAPDGVFLANTIDVYQGGRFAAALRATLRAVFAHVEAVSVERRDDWPLNFVFVASDAPLDLAGVARTDPADPDGPPLPLYRWSAADLDALERRAGARPLRDDFAPVEALLAPLVERAAPR